MTLDKLILHDRIKLALWRNGGVVEHAAEEIGVSPRYVRWVVEKLRREEDRDVKMMAANMILRHLLDGYHQRTSHYQETLRKFRRKETIYVSMCHKAPVTTEHVKGELRYYCLKCKKLTDPIEATDAEAFNIKDQALQGLMKNDMALIQAARLLDYRDGLPPLEPAESGKRKVVQAAQPPRQIEDVAMSEAVKAMHPRDKENIIKIFEKVVLRKKLEIEYKHEEVVAAADQKSAEQTHEPPEPPAQDSPAAPADAAPADNTEVAQ